MADDVLINKAATIERCVARALEEYVKGASKKSRYSSHRFHTARCGHPEYSTCLRSSAGHGTARNPA